ncbi:MAG: hypothetical protein PHX54_08930 [Lentimicrobiaceae bacterium]|nr:hypothetical protein [Lentimicrobiaceae bacterium]
MKTRALLLYSFLMFLIGCNTNNASKTEIVQKHRDIIVDVSESIVDIKTEILLGSSHLYITDNFLIVAEISPKNDKCIHLFNKNSFEYLSSTGIIGRGPGEITNLGRIGIDENNKILWVVDHGKKVMHKFPLDSILANNNFKPTSCLNMNEELLLVDFGFLNDSIVLGRALHPLSHSTFDMTMTKLNVNTNEIERFGYENPECSGKKTIATFSLSVENNFYVNCYDECDLLTICDLDGNVKHNVYGPGWNDKDQDKKAYYFGSDIFNGKIVAAYIGYLEFVFKGNITRGAAPSTLIVFEKDGRYLKTINTGYEFERFCIDEENKRIIAYFIDREEPLGYFNIPVE